MEQRKHIPVYIGDKTIVYIPREEFLMPPKSGHRVTFNTSGVVETTGKNGSFFEALKPEIVEQVGLSGVRKTVLQF
jgi:hypothetical protein